MNSQASSIEKVDPGWSSLFKIAGVAAVIMALFIPLQVVVFVVSPPPTSVTGWFTLMQSNWLIGLLDLDLLLIVDQVLMGLILLALYVLLRRVSPSFMAIALMFGVVGVAAYFASTSAFEMLTLARQYAVADSAQQPMLLAAGQMLMLNWQGTAFSVGYVLEGIALLILAVVMWRSPYFGRATSAVAILLGLLSLLPPTAGTIGMIFALGSLIPLEIWALLVARRLFQLARQDAIGLARADAKLVAS